MKKCIIFVLLILLSVVMFVSCASDSETPAEEEKKGLTIVFKDTKYNGKTVSGLDGTYTIVDTNDTFTSDSSKEGYYCYKLYKQDGKASEYFISFYYEKEEGLSLDVLNKDLTVMEWWSKTAEPKGAVTRQNNTISLKAASDVFYEATGDYKSERDYCNGTVKITVDKDITLRVIAEI